MGRPMIPSPMNPTFMTACSSGSADGAQRER